jgi:translation initiation factor 3 subunit E
LATIWGKLAARIMSDDLTTALDDLNRLKDAIEAAPLASASHTLQQRTWFLHWSLYVLFRVEGGFERLFEIFMTTRYVDYLFLCTLNYF